MFTAESNQDLINEKTRAEIKKLNLEVSCLKKQVSWRGQLAQYAAAVTVMITLFGAWQGYLKFREDHLKDQQLKSKENELKDSEERQRADTEYQLHVQQIAAYPGDTKQTIPSVVLRFQGLKRLIEGGKLSTQAEQARHDVGFLISYIIQQTDFDLRAPRNVEFDTESLEHFEYYPAYLRHNPTANMRILSKYHAGLNFDRARNPGIYKTIRRESGTRYSIESSNAQEEVAAHYIVDMLDAYKSHLDLLKQSLRDAPQGAENVAGMLDRALCGFHASVGNDDITQDFFDLDREALREKLKQCP